MNVNEIFMAIGKIAHCLFLCCPPAGRLRVKHHLLSMWMLMQTHDWVRLVAPAGAELITTETVALQML